MAGDDVVSQVLTLHRLVGARLEYAPGSTYVGVAVEEVFARGRGVCQDYAHLAIGLCRSVGIPARYVSGYLFAVDESARTDDTGRVDAGEDKTVRVQTHAWFEAAIPGFGWLALDPTNQQEVGLRHVKIGHGRDYDDVTPLQGVYSGGSGSEVTVNVDIRKVQSSPPTVDPFAVRASASVYAGRNRTDNDRFEQQQQQQQAAASSPSLFPRTGGS